MKVNAYWLYRIAQNFGGENFGEFGETNIIHQYFTQLNSRFTKVANVSCCKSANIFLAKTDKMIDSPKFYPTKIVHYTLYNSKSVILMYLVKI